MNFVMRRRGRSLRWISRRQSRPGPVEASPAHVDGWEQQGNRLGFGCTYTFSKSYSFMGDRLEHGIHRWFSFMFKIALGLRFLFVQ